MKKQTKIQNKKEEENISIFSAPDKIDAYIKDRIKYFRSRKYVGGSWNENELQLIDDVIWDYITKQGLSRAETARQISARWDINVKTAYKYIQQALKRFVEENKEDVDALKQIFLERCESILQNAREYGMNDTALRSMDMMAKALGFYQNNKEIEINTENNNIVFKFQ